MYSDDARQVVTLPCNHKVHRTCITQWLTHGILDIGTCPYCRRVLCTRHSDLRDNDFADEVLAVWDAEDDQDKSDREEFYQDELRQQIAELEEYLRLLRLYIIQTRVNAVAELEALRQLKR